MTYDNLNDELLAMGTPEVNIIPVMQGDGAIKINDSDLPEKLPILALRNAVIFPGTVYPVTIGRDKSVKLIKDAEKNNLFIGAVPQLDVNVEDPHAEDLSQYGTVAKIVKTLEMPDGTITAILQGFHRLAIDSVVAYEPYIVAQVHYLQDIMANEKSLDNKMIAESLKEKAATIIKSSSFASKEAVVAIKSIDNLRNAKESIKGKHGYAKETDNPIYRIRHDIK